MNTVLYVHYTQSKWANAPTGSEWASKSAAHRWMDIWKKNGLFEQIVSSMESMARMAAEIHPEQRTHAHPEMMTAQAPFENHNN